VAVANDVIDQFRQRARRPGFDGLRRTILSLRELFEKLRKRDVLL
jgi:hypothetical protein